jgi:hypothetical protein
MENHDLAIEHAAAWKAGQERITAPDVVAVLGQHARVHGMGKAAEAAYLSSKDQAFSLNGSLRTKEMMGDHLLDTRTSLRLRCTGDYRDASRLPQRHSSGFQNLAKADLFHYLVAIDIWPDNQAVSPFSLP